MDMYTTVRSQSSDCVHEIDVAPLVMRVIRSDLREYDAIEMSLHHFRTLLFVYNNHGASLSDVAEHIGLSLPAMFTLADGLVSRGLMIRQENRDDRRQMALLLTSLGRTKLDSTYKATMVNLAKKLRRLPSSDCATIITIFRLLRSTFSNE